MMPYRGDVDTKVSCSSRLPQQQATDASAVWRNRSPALESPASRPSGDLNDPTTTTIATFEFRYFKAAQGVAPKWTNSLRCPCRRNQVRDCAWVEEKSATARWSGVWRGVEMSGSNQWAAFFQTFRATWQKLRATELTTAATWQAPPYLPVGYRQPFTSSVATFH